MRKSFNRRALLRGLGGAVVAAPFLSSVAEREAKTQGLPPPPAPKRLIVLYTHHGCLTNRWFPAKSHGALSKADYMAMPTLAPMAPYADKLLMVRGIRSMNEWSFEGTLGQMNDAFTNANGSKFTCHPLTPNATASSASNPGKFDGKPTGRSLDHICAEQVNPGGGPPLFIQIGGVQGSMTNNMFVISWDQPGQIFPGIGTPVKLFSELTNLFNQGPVSPDTYAVARRRGVIDCVREDLNNLRRVNMSSSDRNKLNAWADLLQQTGRTIVPAQCTADTASTLGLTAESVAAGGDLSKVTPLMMDLAVLNAICDTNRVIFLKLPGSANLRFLPGVTGDATSISQRTGNAAMGGACVANVIEMIHTIDKWYAQQFAYLVGRLDSVVEGDRKLLDNTATVWFNELSDGNSHNLNNLPILQAGSCGDYFKVGQAVNVEGGKTDMTPGHSDEDCVGGQTPFAQIDSWGTPPNIATQPINKYFCNLMNAIGVKADTTGYPAPGGTAPVIKFGKYDDTTLFRTDTPSLIKDPGEYSALRAT